MTKEQVKRLITALFALGIALVVWGTMLSSGECTLENKFCQNEAETVIDSAFDTKEAFGPYFEEQALEVSREGSKLNW